MRRLYLLLVLLVVGLAVGCGGGTGIKETPAHLLNGNQEMQKGVAAYQRGCYLLALDHFFRAHERFTVSDQLDGVAMSMNNIGNAYRYIGDPASARFFLDEAIAIYTALGDNRKAVQALSNQAALLIDQNMLEQAQVVLLRAEKLAEGSQAAVSLLNNRGVLLLKQNDYEQAEAVLRRGLARVSTEDQLQAATLNFTMGQLMQATARFEPARTHFEKALETDRQQGFHKGIADDLTALGSLCLQQQQYAAAAGYFQRSIKIYALIENKARVEATWQQLEDAAAKADLDIRVTRLFVERWMAGKILESPCK